MGVFREVKAERGLPEEVAGAGANAGASNLPPLTATAFQSPQGSQLRRALSLVTLAWIFGSVWTVAISGTPLTLFARGLNASNFQLGVLAAIPFIASFASLPASLLIERTGARKTIFMCALYFNRVLWIPIAIVPVWIVHTYGMAASGQAMFAFLALLLCMHLGQAVGGPPWTSWMSDLVPERIRGRYFCRRRQWGILSIIPAAIMVGYVLDRHRGESPIELLGVIAIIFCIACVFGVTDIALFHFVPAIPKAPQRGAHLIQSLAEPLKNRQFLAFAGFMGLMTFAVASQGQFVTLYLTEKLQIGNAKAQFMLLVTPLLAQLLMLPIWGKMADRMGKKPMLMIGSLGLVPVGLGWVLVTSGNEWLGYVMSAAGAAMWTAFEVANFNFMLEMSGSDEPGRKGGTSYVAVNGVIINIAGCAGGLTFGAIAQGLRDWNWQPFDSIRPATFYDVLFISSAGLRLLAAVIFLPLIHESGAKPTREALRFMTANIYNNVFSAILLPLRSLGISKRESYVEAEETK